MGLRMGFVDYVVGKKIGLMVYFFILVGFIFFINVK